MAAQQPERRRNRRRSLGRTQTVSGRGLRIVISSAPARAAPRIAKALVLKGVAACVSVVPGVRSTYRWRGRLESTRESLLVIKTTVGGLPACLAALATGHPYEVPEGLVLTPSASLVAYASWLEAQCGSAST